MFFLHIRFDHIFNPCRSLSHLLIFWHQTNLLFNASQNKANYGIRSMQIETASFLFVNFRSSFTDIISYQMALYSTSSMVHELTMAVEITDVYNCNDTISSKLVRKYYAAFLQWNLSSSNVHCPSLKYWVPSGQCWMTSWPCTHQMYLLQRDLCGKYTPFRFGLHGKSGSIKK